jgi:nucleoside recognition membrane protein YjiH
MTVGFIFKMKGQAAGSKPILDNAGKGRKSVVIPAVRQNISNLGTMFGDAVKNSIYLVINIGAFIIFFSVVINLLIKTGVIDLFSGMLDFLLSPLGLGSDVFSSILSGLFEITTGTDLASKLSNISIGTQLVVTSFIIGWAGLSVHSQVYSIIGKTGISLKPYILGKFLQGLIASIYTYICLQLDFIRPLVNQPVLGSVHAFSNIKWQDVLLTSVKYLVFVLLIYVLFWFVSVVSKRFKRNKT